jgi:RNA polymerase sigma-70 factor (ECF subfamily)
VVREADFDELYTSCAHRLTGQLYLLTGSRAEAEDCVQEAFERAWLRWSQVSRADSPEAWVRTVARRLAVSRWRRTRNAVTAWNRRAVPEELEAHDRSSTDRLALVAALQQLPTAQRTAIVLHHLCDLDVAAVSVETGQTPSAVKSQLSRGRQRLAGLLGDPATHQTASQTQNGR